MNIIFFGVSGNSGLYCLKKFLNEGWDVIGVSRSSVDLIHPNFKHIIGDIRDKNIYNKLPTDVDLVVNFAGVQPSILSFSEKTDIEKTLNEYIDVNINGVFNILEFVRKNKIKNYIYSTSHREFEGYWRNDYFITNNLPPKINYSGDHVMYAITKTSAKMIGDYYGECFGTRVFNLRLPMMFLIPNEPYYLKNGKKEIMPFLKIIFDAYKDKSLEIWGDPNLKRDYVYIENLSNLIFLCLNSDLSNGTFNVATGEAVTTENFIKSIGRRFSSHPNELKYIYKPEKKTYKCAIYNIDEQKNLLGYEPILLDEMLMKLKNDILNEKVFSKWGWI